MAEMHFRRVSPVNSLRRGAAIGALSNKKAAEFLPRLNSWWTRVELNYRHSDFQSIIKSRRFPIIFKQYISMAYKDVFAHIGFCLFIFGSERLQNGYTLKATGGANVGYHLGWFFQCCAKK